MMKNERVFKEKYFEAGKKRAKSLKGTYWDIQNVIEFFNSKSILYAHVDGENEITIHNRFATKSNIKTIEDNVRYVKVIKKEKNTTFILM